MATITIPTAPRSMQQRASGGTASSISSPDEVFASALRDMYPRLALYEALAGFKDERKRRAPSNDHIVEARRDFLDSFAYLCDDQKGGGTVTAAALQQLDLSNILWLAANEGIRSDIKAYAEDILSRLQAADPSTQITVQDDIFNLAVKKCHARITHYNDKMQQYARNCRMQLRAETRNETVKRLRNRLKKLSEPPSTTVLADIVDSCYGMRGPEVDEIKRRSKHALDDFDKLAHYIGRLGATRSSANSVVAGMIMVPALRQISDIRTVKAPDTRAATLGPSAMSPYEILRGICEDPVSQNPLQNKTSLHALVELDLPSGSGDVRTRLKSWKTFDTRVHAELQILDMFSRNRSMEFVDGDKYIGCSKPACYFCFNWISSHMHDYVPPATHNKIIPGCRGPDGNLNESGIAVLKDMNAKICSRLGQDILGYLLNSASGHTHTRHQYQSTEGSSRA